MVDNRQSLHRVVTVAGIAATLIGATLAASGDAQAVTTPPTFGPQVDVGSGFSQPWGVAVGPDGDTYVADTRNSVVYRVSAADGTITTVGSGLRIPQDVAVDSNGNVYIADWGNGRVVRVAGSNGQQTVAAGGLSAPSTVAVDAAGDLFIANSGAGTVLEQPVNTSQLNTVVAGINFPTGVAVDSSGAVYVADSSNANSSVTKVVPGGTTTVLPIAGLQNPNGIDLDAAGNLFIANAGANNVLMVTPDGTTSHVGGGYISPEGLAVNSSGDVIVADTFNPRVTLNPSSDPQSISLTRAIPSRIAPGTTADLGATGGGSGNPVVFSVDPNTYPGDACSITATPVKKVKFKKVGTCVIDLDQAGAFRYLSAHSTVTVTIRPAGMTALAIAPMASQPAAGNYLAVAARGVDAQGNDLGDVSAITTFTVDNGTCYQAFCVWDLAGPSTIRASAVGARGSQKVSVTLGTILVSNGAQVDVFPATVGTAIDGYIDAYGGSSGTYTFTRTAGTLPPGVKLRADGVLRGTPTTAGTYPITVLVKDSTTPGQRATVPATIVVTSPGSLDPRSS